MKLFTVTRIETIDHDTVVTPFAEVYKTHDAAIQSVEADGLEMFEYLVDPNDGDDHRWPGLNASDDKMRFATKDDGSDESTDWEITLVELKD